MITKINKKKLTLYKTDIYNEHFYIVLLNAIFSVYKMTRVYQNRITNKQTTKN